MMPGQTDQPAGEGMTGEDRGPDREGTPEEHARDRALMRGPLSAGPPRDQDRRALELCARILRTWPDPLDSRDVDEALDAIAFSLGWTVFAGGLSQGELSLRGVQRAQRRNDERRNLPDLQIPPPGLGGNPANRLERIEALELAFNVMRAAHGERLDRIEGWHVTAEQARRDGHAHTMALAEHVIDRTDG